MILKTKRLMLRPWELSDAESCYEYAKDPLVGPIAGWPVHISVENSKEIIENVLAVPETYAVCLKTDNKAIGSIGLLIGDKSNIGLSDDEAEIGYWIGMPFWGQGLIPEAVRELMRYAFEELNMKKLWCGYFDGNEKSKRVQEKCGFKYQLTNENVEWSLMHDIRTEHITCITAEEWRTRI
jgi:ribosomal-protein-alanine N-acetyltransferase